MSALAINKEYSAGTSVFVHKDNDGQMKSVPQKLKQLDVKTARGIRSANRRALNDVSNKASSSLTTNDGSVERSAFKKPTSSSSSLSSEPDVSRQCTTSSPIVNHSFPPEDHLYEELEIETMPISQFQEEDYCNNIWPLELQVTLDDLDRLMGNMFDPINTDDCIPPAQDDDDLYDNFLDLTLIDLPSLESSLEKLTLEDITLAKEVPLTDFR